MIREDGTVGAYRVLHNFYPHRGIDGMGLDPEGNLVATAGWEESGPGPMLYVFAPNGRVLATHPVPALPTGTCGNPLTRGEFVGRPSPGSRQRGCGWDAP